MNKKHFWIVALILGISSGCLFGQTKPSYKNPRLSSKERTLNLLSMMTLEEKIGQLRCPLGWEMYEKSGNKISHSLKFEELIKTQHIGMFWAVYRADQAT